MPERRTATAPPDVAELVRMSREVGSDPALVQCGGGNASVKSDDGETMVVKASGTAMSDMEPGRGYRRVALRPVLDMLADPELGRMESASREREAARRLAGAALDDIEGRPSVETPLHAFLPRAVCHTHPAFGNGVCCARLGSELAAEWFADLGGPPLFVPYVDPGLPLARRTFKRVKSYAEQHGAPPKLLFLKNHGVFASADSAEEAVALSRRVNDTAREKWEAVRTRAVGPHAVEGDPDPAARDRVSEAMRRIWRDALQSDPLVVFSADTAVRVALAHPGIAELMRVPPLTPDHVVYAHGQPLWIEPQALDEAVDAQIADALQAARERLPRAPVAALVSGLGLFAAGANRSAALAALAISSASLLTLLAAHEFGGCRGLTPRAIRYLEEWEAESFRRSVNREG